MSTYYEYRPISGTRQFIRGHCINNAEYLLAFNGGRYCNWSQEKAF